MIELVVDVYYFQTNIIGRIAFTLVLSILGVVRKFYGEATCLSLESVWTEIKHRQHIHSDDRDSKTKNC